MAKVYGYSDDIVCIEHIDGGSTEIDCYNRDVRISFEDGTVIRVGYPKDGFAIWWIEIEEEGYAYSELTPCTDEDAEVYSDVFVIDAEAESYAAIGRKHPDWK